jgi:tetratricopeptide (TPR) repeat protein
MGRYKILLIAVAITVCCSLIPGCSHIRKPFTKTKTPVSEAEVIEASETTMPATSKAEEAMASGDYQQALELYRIYWEKNPRDEELLSAYVQAIETIKKEADAARSQGNYSSAINYYQLLAGNYAQFSSFASRLSFNSRDLEAGIKESSLARHKAEINRSIIAGKYQRAFNLMAEALRGFPGDKDLQNLCYQTMSKIKASADKAMTEKDYALAGENYSLLKGACLKLNRVAPDIPLSLTELDGAIEECSTYLTNQGLIEYRKGKLKEAIDIWESLLSFQPENEEIKKAIQTARDQLNKIKH